MLDDGKSKHTDFAWPPPESDLDALEIIDLEPGRALELFPVEPPRKVLPFTRPPAHAATIVSDALRRRHAKSRWSRLAAAVLFCAGGALVEHASRIGPALRSGPAMQQSADARGNAGPAAMTPPGMSALVEARLPPGRGDVGALPIAVAAPARSDHFSVAAVARTHAPATPAAAPSAPLTVNPTPALLVASAASLPMPSPVADTRPSTETPDGPSPEIVGAPDEARIEATLDRYRTAYASLDAAMARSVWPSVDTRALERAFGSLKSQGLAFDGCKTDLRGPDATVACRGRATYVPRVGSQRPRTEEHQWRFRLRKVDQSWMIVDADAH